MLALALATALAAAPASLPPLLAPTALPGAQPSRVALVRADQAPVPFGTCLTASVLGYFTGLTVMATAGLGTPAGLNGAFDAAILARVGAGALLMSLAPGFGDFANGLTDRFLLRSGIRATLAGLLIAWVALAAATADPVSLSLAIVAAVFGGGGWFIWGIVDAVHSVSAPERWAERENEQRRRAHAPSLGPPAPLFRF